MQIIETNLPTNGSFKRRNSTDEIILHHAEASRASVEESTAGTWNAGGPASATISTSARTARFTEAARNGRSARTRRGTTAAQSAFAARAAT